MAKIKCKHLYISACKKTFKIIIVLFPIYPYCCKLRRTKVKKSKYLAGCWWPMPVILVTQEEETRRITV
jgi:hypothetical protein